MEEQQRQQIEIWSKKIEMHANLQINKTTEILKGGPQTELKPAVLDQMPHVLPDKPEDIWWK